MQAEKIEVPLILAAGRQQNGEISRKVDQDCAFWEEIFQVKLIKGENHFIDFFIC